VKSTASQYYKGLSFFVKIREGTIKKGEKELASEAVSV
jgi:hypothetical protein